MKTLRKYLLDGIKFYEDLSDHSLKRAEQVANDSDRRNDNLMTAKFNEGRATAFKELYEIIIGEDGDPA